MLIEAVLDVSLLTLMGAGVKSRIIFVFADTPSLTVLLLVVVALHIILLLMLHLVIILVVIHLTILIPHMFAFDSFIT